MVSFCVLVLCAGSMYWFYVLVLLVTSNGLHVLEIKICFFFNVVIVFIILLLLLLLHILLI